MSEGRENSLNVLNETRQFMTRTELPQSPEGAERHQALETLVNLGLLVPVTQLETYHGRVGKKDETWRVDPHFTNHGNSTGNRNVNQRSTLYTSDEQTARKFAVERIYRDHLKSNYETLRERVQNYTPEERLSWLMRINEVSTKDPFFPREYTLEDLSEGSFYYSSNLGDEIAWLARQDLEEKLRTRSLDNPPELHQIVPQDPNALALDTSFMPTKLEDKDRERYTQALQALVIPITEGSPVDFESRHSIQKFLITINKLKKDLVLSKDIEEIIKDAGIDEIIALQLSSAYNSRQMALTNPAYLADRLLRYPSAIFTDTIDIDGKKEEIPINLEYAERYMRALGIVALKQSLESATLGRDITSISFFDLERIGTREQVVTQKQEMLKKMGGLMDKFPPILANERDTNAKELIEALSDPYIKPERLMELAKKIGDFKNIYESDAGNWEGFTLEEHTETVLRNFDENFADIIPIEYLAPIRLSILVHDLGKPQSVANGEKHRQKSYNAYYAKRFLDNIGVQPGLNNFIVAIITDGAELAFKSQRMSSDQTLQGEMKMFSEDVLQKYLDSDNIGESEIEAFREMCKIFQLCDGGAYTSMAITRRDGKGRFRNFPSFNSSFREPIGLGKRDIKYL